MSQRSYDGETVLWSAKDLDRIRDHFPHIRSNRGLVDAWFRLWAVGILAAAGHHDCTGLAPSVLSSLGRIHQKKKMIRLTRKLLRLGLHVKEAEVYIRRWRQAAKDRRLLTTALRLQTRGQTQEPK